jgi:hypothetical protein
VNSFTESLIVTSTAGFCLFIGWGCWTYPANGWAYVIGTAMFILGFAIYRTDWSKV